MRATKYRVGTLTAREAREVTEHYECAAWHKTLRCGPGTYPVYAYLDWCNVKEGHLGHTLYAPFEGEVTSACFVNRIGAQYGGDRGPELVGKVEQGSVKLPTFDLRRHVRAEELELDPALVVAETFTGQDGKERTFYRLNRESGTLREDLAAARAA